MRIGEQRNADKWRLQNWRGLHVPGALVVSAGLSIYLLSLVVIGFQVAVAEDEHVQVADSFDALPPDGLAEFAPPPEFRTPVVCSVEIEIADVFEGDDLYAFQDVANAMKVETKQSVIRRELVFKKGQPYNKFLVEESERNLRSLRFLRDVRITPVFVDVKEEGSGEVKHCANMKVHVQETWTFFPVVGGAVGGGTQKQSVGLMERNLLGYGKRLDFIYREDEERTALEGVWRDNRLLGSREQLNFAGASRSDGYRFLGNVGRPFHSLTQPYAWNVVGYDADYLKRLYQYGDEVSFFNLEERYYSPSFTISRGNPQVAPWHLTAGYRYSDAGFGMPTAQDYEDADIEESDIPPETIVLPQDRRFSGPYLGVRRLEPDYVSVNYIDSFERMEDYNLGNDLVTELHFAGKAFGSLDNALLFLLSDSDALRLGDGHFLRGEVDFSGRVLPEGLNNVVAGVEAKYVHRIGNLWSRGAFLGKHTSLLSSRLETTHDYDLDRQLVVGALDGLRGYEDRMFAGEHRFLFNAEHRVFLIEELFQVLNIGAAAFLDVGGVSDAGIGRIFTQNIYSDVGIGLRLGFPRAAGGGVVRIDLGFPLRSLEEEGVSTWEPRLTITAGQEVSARLRKEQDPADLYTLSSP